MKYVVEDLVYFEDYSQKGVGKVVDTRIKGKYLVHSTNIAGGHYGYCEDNDNNWWFKEEYLKPFTKKVGQKYKLLENYPPFKKGNIVILYELEEDNLSFYKCDSDYGYLFDLDHAYSQVEFYEDVPSVKENEMFTIDDIKPGYLVKLRSGELAHVVNTKQRGLCLNFEDGLEELSSYNNDLIFGPKGLEDLDIVEVYDFTEDGFNANMFEIRNRDLLWKREEVKETTIKAMEAIDKAIEDQINISGELGVKVGHLRERDKQYVLEEGFNFMEDVNDGFIIYKVFDDYDYEEDY